MIIVLDTNVLVSATLSRKGSPAEIIRRWENEEFDVATSSILLQELEEALRYDRVRKYTKISDQELKSFLDRFRLETRVVDPQMILSAIEKDPDDNRVLECALESGADYIVAGDKHLLEIKEYEGIVILSPASFLTLLPL